MATTTEQNGMVKLHPAHTPPEKPEGYHELPIPPWAVAMGGWETWLASNYVHKDVVRSQVELFKKQLDEFLAGFPE